MKFLVAVDGSEISHRALDYALEIAVAADADVSIVHSVDPPVYAESSPEPLSDRSEVDRLFVIERIQDTEDRGSEILQGAVARAREHGVDAASVLLYGDPVVTIADFAEENDFDGIVVGHHGASERSETTFGSVAKELVTRGRVPVTVVR